MAQIQGTSSIAVCYIYDDAANMQSSFPVPDKALESRKKLQDWTFDLQSDLPVGWSFNIPGFINV
jgi:hypothetical protein